MTKVLDQIREKSNCRNSACGWIVIVHTTLLSLRIWYCISYIAMLCINLLSTSKLFNSWGKSKFLSFFFKNKLNWGTRSRYNMWHVCKHIWMHCCLFPHAYLIHDVCALKMCVETPQTIPVLNCVCVCDSQPSCQFEACQTYNPAPATSSWFIPIHFYPSFSCSSTSPFPVSLLQP